MLDQNRADGQRPVAVGLDVDLLAIGQCQEALLAGAVGPQRRIDLEGQHTRRRLPVALRIEAAGLRQARGQGRGLTHSGGADRQQGPAHGQEQLVLFVTIKNGRVAGDLRQLLPQVLPALGLLERVDLARDVGEHEPTFEVGDGVAVVHEAADDRVAGAAVVVLVHEGGFGQASAHTSDPIGALVALQDGPSVVAALDHPVDLLERALTDIAHPDVAAHAVDGPAPGVAKAQGEDLRPGSCSGHERVARWHGVARRRADIDADHLAQQAAQVLHGGVLPSVTEGRVKKAVRAELQRAAPVQRRRPGHPDEHLFGILVQREPVVAADEPGDAPLGGRAAGTGPAVVNVDLSVGSEVRVHDHAEQAHLPLVALDRGLDPIAQVHEVAGSAERATLSAEAFDHACAVDQVPLAGVVGRAGHAHRAKAHVRDGPAQGNAGLLDRALRCVAGGVGRPGVQAGERFVGVARRGGGRHAWDAWPNRGRSDHGGGWGQGGRGVAAASDQQGGGHRASRQKQQHPCTL